jgi:uncharacterized repeat protein (TIGR01451 family)
MMHSNSDAIPSVRLRASSKAARRGADRPQLGRSAQRALALAVVVISGILAGTPVAAQDLPLPGSNLQRIPAGSLIIPMDNAKQNEGSPGTFNLRAYGLVNDLLHADIPAKWVIRAGKARDAADFTAAASRVAPTALASASLDFAGGPIIIHQAYAERALARIATYNAAASTRRVHVYQLTQDVTVDVRHELTFKPRPFVNSTNANIATGVLNTAGFTSAQYTVGTNADIRSNGCYTILIEPHNTTTTAAGEIRRFVEGGGNFYAQCASVTAFENEAASGRYLTVGGTTGLTVANTGNADIFPNPDLPFSQFIGTVTQSPGGSEEDFRLSAGATFRSHAHPHVQATGTFSGGQPYAALAGKIRSGLGGMVFYVGGHDNRGTSLGDINLQRMMLNAVLTPADRPSICNILVAVPDLTITKTHSGSFYVDSISTYTLGVSNIGNGPTAGTTIVTDTLPAGVNFHAATGAGWSFAVSGQIVTATYASTIPAGSAIQLQIQVRMGAAAIGTVTNRAWVQTGGEPNTGNNVATHVGTAVGQPRLSLTKTAAPDSSGTFGAFLTYTIRFFNSGSASALSAVVTDSIPPLLEFVVGSARSELPPEVNAALEYSSDGTTWGYLPVSGGCGAPAGLDGCVTHIRWRLLDPFRHEDPGNAGTAYLSARIR